MPFTTSSFRRSCISLDRPHAFHGRHCRPSHPCHRSSMSSFFEVPQERSEEWKGTGDGVEMEQRDTCHFWVVSIHAGWDVCPTDRGTHVSPLCSRDGCFSWNSARARTTQAMARETNVPRCEEGIPSDHRILPCVRHGILLVGYLVQASLGFLILGWMLERS